MTQWTQEQRVDDDLPSKSRKELNEEESCDVPEITSWEEGKLRCIADSKERDGKGGEEERALRDCHRSGDVVTLQRMQRGRQRNQQCEVSGGRIRESRGDIAFVTI